LNGGVLVTDLSRVEVDGKFSKHEVRPKKKHEREVLIYNIQQWERKSKRKLHKYG
jgi:hypothetical protein